MQCVKVFSWAIFCLCYFSVVEPKPKGGNSGGGGQGITQADIGNLKDAIQLLIESQADLKTDLKDDSASVRDEVANLRDDVSNLRDGLSDLRDDVANLRDGESLEELKKQLNELKNDIAVKVYNDSTRTDITPVKSEGQCNATMGTDILKEDLKAVKEHMKNLVETCQPGSDDLLSKVWCNATTGTDILKEDLNAMKEHMKKLVETCQPGSDDLISKAVNNVTFPVAEDCSGQSDGIYIIFKNTKTGKPFLARCEGGWLILAHRYDGSVNFDLDWCSYKESFGDILGEHFIGMNNIVSLLQQKIYKARFDLTTWENETRYAEYSIFDINDESDKYRLNIDGFSGTAGDSMIHANHDQFSTKEADNDGYSAANCAMSYKGPYWYGQGCNGALGSIFGKYIKGSKCTDAHGCITWYYWPKKLPGVTNNSYYSFKEAKLKIRPI